MLHTQLAKAAAKENLIRTARTSISLSPLKLEAAAGPGIALFDLLQVGK